MIKFMENTGNQLKLLPEVLERLDNHIGQLATVGSRLHRHGQWLARMEGQPSSEEGAVDREERDTAASAAAVATNAAAREIATATDVAAMPPHMCCQDGALGFPALAIPASGVSSAGQELLGTHRATPSSPFQPLTAKKTRSGTCVLSAWRARRTGDTSLT